ncbi:beta-lactamase superfamily domain-domain-containing protein [Absidia repens]|uniref:Beta-lactamase superfamily domain-domain-containing protein n=1 Tax=Absidia repens TaxID=90262 RepID=A0A1X2II14_9FUNG|nr:beta-lactamase superfamily domain-domain-containing protein [Absidia repens]
MLRFFTKHRKPIIVACSISAASLLLTNNFAPPITAMAQQHEESNKRSSNKDHHDGSKFRNPWSSATEHGLMDTFKAIGGMQTSRVVKEARPEDLPEKVNIDWDLLRNNTTDKEEKIVVTWLGHACALVQINGFNVLFDPIFSCRCSPVQFAGPKRYTSVPCELDDLPKIDAVVISHNHYDHLDSETIQSLAKKNPNTRFFVPLGNKEWFGQISNEKDGFGNDRVVELDWWESSTLDLSQSTSMTASSSNDQLKLICTPCQHFSGRTLWDRNKTLWASWCVEGIHDGVSNRGKVFFGGDTGYRSVPITAGKENEHDEEYLQTLPHCPAFKDIGDEIGPFDISLIPIGAYSPRWFMSTIHCSPEDAVRVHEDVKSKHSIGIHWGTFALTDEPAHDPPKRLKLALEKRGHSINDFNVLKLGESYVSSTKNNL